MTWAVHRLARGVQVSVGMTAESGDHPKRPRRRTTPPSVAIEKHPKVQGLQRRQSAVIRDLIRLDVTTPRFETEGLALIRSLLEED
jgi:hypothetical protein